MRLQTLGKLRLFSEQGEVDIETYPLVLLAHLLIDGEQQQETLANRFWWSRRDDFDSDDKPVPLARMRKVRSALRTALRKHVGRDLMKASAGTETLRLSESIACDYVDLIRALQHRKPHELSPEHLKPDTFLAGLENSNRLDIGNFGQPEDHPLYQWIREKREKVARLRPMASDLSSMGPLVEQKSVAGILAEEFRLSSLDDLFQFCLSPAYPLDESQRAADLEDISRKVLGNLDAEHKVVGWPEDLLLLVLVFLTGGYARPFYVEKAFERFVQNGLPHSDSGNLRAELEDLASGKGILMFLHEEGYLLGNHPVTLVARTVIESWVENHSSLSARLLESLLQVVPRSEAAVWDELCAAPVEVVMQLSQAYPDLILQAAQQQLIRGFPEQAMVLLDYGINNRDFDEGRHTYAVLLLGYAFERSGQYGEALETLGRISAGSAWSRHPLADKRLPASLEDAQALLDFLKIRTGGGGESMVAELEMRSENVATHWSTAKNLSTLGNYYQVRSANDPQAAAKAFDYHTRAVQFWEHLVRNPEQVAGEMTNLANTYAITGLFEQAEEQFERTMAWISVHRAPGLARLRTLMSAAALWLNQEEYARALDFCNKAELVVGAHKQACFMMRNHFHKAVCFDELSRTGTATKDQARKQYAEARSYAERIDDMAMQGRVAASIGVMDKNKALVDEGIKLLAGSGDKADLEDYVALRDELWPDSL